MSRSRVQFNWDNAPKNQGTILIGYFTDQQPAVTIDDNREYRLELRNKFYRIEGKWLNGLLDNSTVRLTVYPLLKNQSSSFNRFPDTINTAGIGYSNDYLSYYIGEFDCKNLLGVGIGVSNTYYTDDTDNTKYHDNTIVSCCNRNSNNDISILPARRSGSFNSKGQLEGNGCCLIIYDRFGPARHDIYTGEFVDGLLYFIVK